MPYGGSAQKRLPGAWAGTGGTTAYVWYDLGRGAVGKSGLFFLPPRRRAGLYTTGRGVGKDPAALGLSPRALKLPEMHPECRIFSSPVFLVFFGLIDPRGEF